MDTETYNKPYVVILKEGKNYLPAEDLRWHIEGGNP